VGSMAVLHSFQRARDLLVKDVIDYEAMLTHRFPLDDYTTAIDTFPSGEGPEGPGLSRWDAGSAGSA
jgi:threonine dehydrogenase-like Zn-dependent dehydrogenase